MMKSVVSVLFVFAVIFFAALSPAAAQKKKMTVPKVQPASAPAPDLTPKGPTFVAIDAPHKTPPLSFNITELKFGSQGTGVQSCMYVTVTNVSPAPQTLIGLSTDDDKNYSIPSPSQKMLPISIQPRSNLTISVCFKPEKIGSYKSRLVFKTPEDSTVIPIDGKAIKPEDVGKLPKTDLTVIPKKKGHTWNFKLQLVSSAKITLQLFDDLGNVKVGFLNGDFKNEGVYEIPFEGLDKGKLKLPPGKYYLRCQIEETARGSQVPVKFTKVIEIS